MSELKAAILPLEEGGEIDLIINDSIVVTYLDIRRHLNTVSKSHKRYAVFDRGDRFTVIRVTDDLDLRSVYGEENVIEPTKKKAVKPIKEKFNVDDCNLSPEVKAKIKSMKGESPTINLDNLPERKDAHPGFQLADEYKRLHGQE